MAKRYPVEKSEAEWRRELSATEYAVLRQAATEPPGSGPLLTEGRKGVYECRACGHRLFSSQAKFESHCGWPSFFEAADPAAVERSADHSHGMRRVEVRCRRCGSHLGHVFADAPETPTGERYCMNSVALRFLPE